MTVNSIQIVPLDRALVPAVAAMEKENFSVPWTTEDFEKSLHDPYTDYFAALDGQRALGYIGLRLGMDTADITTFCVQKEERRRGIGTMLLEKACDYAAAKGCEKLFLEVRRSNKAACALYEKNGFRFVHERRNYYSHPCEDALVLVKEIGKKM